MMKLICLILAAGAALAQTTRYPGALDSDSSLFVVSDNVQTSLNAAMATVDTAAVVASAAGFVPNMIATICDTSTTTGKCTAWEHMLVTAVAGNVLTVTRGFAGTTARTHASGILVSVLIDSVHQKVLKDSVVAIETALGPNLGNVSAGGGSFLATTYAFSPYSCTSGSICTPGGPGGGSLIAGNNTLTMIPVPNGVNGTDTGHALYVSGGSGAAEACTITGGSGQSGQASGQIIVNCANTHSGAWTIQSASGGLQEATCAMPAPGGAATIPASITLYANVSTCGKTRAAAAKLPGSTITGAGFTIYGSLPASDNGANLETLLSQPNWASGTNFYEGQRFTLGPLSKTDSMFAGTAASVSGAFAAPAGNVYTNIVGISGSGIQYGQHSAIGVFGEVLTGLGGGGGIWGSNFTVGNFSTADPLGKYLNMWGSELDMNVSATGIAPAGVYGAAAVSAMYKDPSYEAVGFDVEKAGVTGHPHYPFHQAFRSQQGAANVGLAIMAGSFVETTTYTFATLPAASAGNNVRYRCTNCTQTTPCAAGGSGAVANGVTGSWDCNPGFGFSQSLQMSGYDATNGASGLFNLQTDSTGDVNFGAQSSVGGPVAFTFGMPGAPKFNIFADGSISPVGVAFASLGAATPTKIQWCTNCIVNATACAAGGSGAWAFSNGTAWKCPF